MDMGLIELREAQVESHAKFQRAAEAVKNADPATADLDKLEADLNESQEQYNASVTAYKAEEDRQVRARQKFELDQRAIAGLKALDATPAADSPKVRVGKEPLTYRNGGDHSFFADVMRRDLKHDQAAAERLSRHSKEMQVERSVKYDLSSTDTAGGDLVSPLYLNDLFVDFARAGRVAADVIGSRNLPPNSDTFSVPRMTSGTSVADQADGGAVSETDAVTDSLAVAVKTVAGMQDVSQQLVDRSVPGIDEIIFADLARAYHVNLDTAVLNSSTTSNKGLLQVSGINSVTYTASTPTVAGLYPKLADAIQQIATGIYRPATAVLMHPRRWAFILASLDSSNRPLVSPIAPQNPAAGFGGVVAQGAVGNIQGLPVFVDPNIPITLGSGTNEDRIIVCAADELMLWEDPSGPYVETFRDVGSGTLTVRFRLHNYWGQLNARRPKAISVVSGTGLATPSF